MEAAFTPVAVQLRDGRRAVLRTIGPQDKDALQVAVKALSPASRYARFMMSVRELSPQMLEAATHPDKDRELALVAVDDEAEGRIVGGARYAGTPGGEGCEFGCAVVDDWQGIGLARRLMEVLMQAARERGFRQMGGYVLASNASMRGLAKRLGFSDSASPDDPTVHIMQRDLDGTA